MIKSLITYMLLLMPLLHIPDAKADTPARRGVAWLSNNYKLNVEIADTEALRRYGLMHRASLAPDSGMLFVYPDQALRAVWMKNTLIALDVLFLSETGKIISMLPSLPPCKTDPCPIYTSKFAARYMLEVNAGFIAQHGITIGQELTLDYPAADLKQRE
jgi:Uncharacterized conserved protein